MTLSLLLKPILFALTLTLKFVSAAENCDWCIRDNFKVKTAAEGLAKLTPAKQIEYVRSQGIEVLVLESGQKVPEGIFLWSKFADVKGPLSEVTSQKALMGKTLCQGEHPLSQKKTTIVLSDVAPRSTLVHEYLHTFQLENDKAWCPLSKALWTKTARSPEEERAGHDKEWDVLVLLWKIRSSLNYDLEDQITIAAEVLEQADKRKGWDSTALPWTVQEKIPDFLNTKIKEYKEKRVAKKKA
jgi:hypothetical protein